MKKIFVILMVITLIFAFAACVAGQPSGTETTAPGSKTTAPGEELGVLAVVANGYNGVYDGMPHGITVSCDGATITYADSENGTYSSAAPTFTDAGTYAVYYKVEKEGYETVSGSQPVTISKADGKVELSATGDRLRYPTAESFTVNTNVSGGVLSVTSTNPAVAAVSVSGATVTVTPGTVAGTTVITVTSAETANYNAASATYEVTVKSGCEHKFENGVCKDCGYVCLHEYNYEIDAFSACSICGHVCDHEFDHEVDPYPVCTVCGYECDHSHGTLVMGDTQYNASQHVEHLTCNVCGIHLTELESHTWGTDGVCKSCRYVCLHEFDNEIEPSPVCTVCGYECDHSHDATVMGYTQKSSSQHVVHLMCNVCGVQFTELESHTWGTDGVCRDCGYAK